MRKCGTVPLQVLPRMPRAGAVPAGAWSTLAVNVKGSLFEVLLNGSKLYDVEDTTFPDAGKVGLWTKADSVMGFDDLRVVVAGGK